MDIISFNEAATANGRIKKFIENPDSNSGILTQPKVIEAGETVTIKNGRQAILADTVVKGNLIVEAGGEVFVPSGATVGDLEDKIDGKASLSHNHDASNINTGTLSVDRLPTIPNTKISGLGTASTRNVGTAGGNVMEVGAFGLGSNINFLPSGWTTAVMYELPSGFYSFIGGEDNPISSYGTVIVSSMQSDRKAIISISSDNTAEIAVSSIIAGAKSYDVLLTHSGNLLTSTGQSTVFPMTQKAVTDAIQGVSDARDKTNIQNTNIGLELIEKLNVVTYNLNKRDWYRSEKATITEEIELEDGTKNTTTRLDDKILKTDLKKYDKNDGHLAKNSIYTGLIAQDVKEAYESLGLDLSIVKNMKDEYEGGDDQYYIEYNGVIPLLINAIKELNNKVKSLEDKLRPEGGL